MSILQKTVGLYPAKGFEGQQVVVGQAFYTDTNYFSDGTVKQVVLHSLIKTV